MLGNRTKKYVVFVLARIREETLRPMQRKPEIAKWFLRQYRTMIIVQLRCEYLRKHGISPILCTFELY